MKKSILFVTVTLFLFSCSSNDSNDSSIEKTQLIGTWLLKNAKLNSQDVTSSTEYKVEFTSTNRTKFYYKNPISNSTFGPDIIENGNYSISGNTILITWDSADPGLETIKYDLLELTNSNLKLQTVISGEGTLVEFFTK